MPYTLVKNDITRMKTDAIVNAANASLLGGGGVDGAIHRAAGPRLLEECRTLHGCVTGDAKITKGYNLHAKYVIHTVGPVWEGGNHYEKDLLYSCYWNSLNLAKEYKLKSIAFPLISTGAFGYPVAEALQVATDAITKFLETNEMDVYLVLYSVRIRLLQGKLLNRLQTYLDDNYIDDSPFYERLNSRNINRSPEADRGTTLFQTCDNRKLDDEEDELEGTYLTRRQELFEEEPEGWEDSDDEDEESYCLYQTIYNPEEDKEPEYHEPYSEEKKELHSENIMFQQDIDLGGAIKKKGNEFIFQLDESFSEMLLRIIKEKEMTETECYKSANIDRKLFSKIRSKKNYKPSKATVFAFIIALHLNMEEAKAMLASAGFAFSHSSKFDLMIEFFIQEGIYNIYEINEALCDYDLPLLGSL